ncbi:putative inner membrane transporter yiJE [Ferrovum sp. JA12]|nr:putative inner membrane transporter yiJE [Ferrovum sp. JA12]
MNMNKKILTSFLVPAVFVFLWATGFIGARYGLPYMEPMTFLAIRMALAAVILLIVALISKAPWPPTPMAALHVTISGLLVHGGYLGGVWAAIAIGMPAGMVSLIVGMQPILTSVAAFFVLKERLNVRQWLGLLIGLIGLFLVLAHRVSANDLTPLSALFSCIGLLSISAGTVYQKKFFASVDIRTGGVLQYCTSGLLFWSLALAFEQRTVVWNPPLVFAMAWSVLALSVGAVALLYKLIRDGEASRVSSLLYLVPPVTALIAFLCFDERLTFFAMIGMALVALGVALVILKFQFRR